MLLNSRLRKSTLITSIYLGNESYSLNSNLDASVLADSSNELFVINGDYYQAAGASLTIQSGKQNKTSSLINGSVLLDTVYSAVNTYQKNSVSVQSGEITLTASASGDSITDLTDGDVFSVASGKAIYSVKGAGLLSCLFSFPATRRPPHAAEARPACEKFVWNVRIGEISEDDDRTSFGESGEQSCGNYPKPKRNIQILFNMP